LIEYGKRKGHDITVVFDGWKTGEGKESRSVIGGITVIFTRIGENADAVIKRIISSVKREWIVVTSDRDIVNHAWASGSIPVPAEAFLASLGKKGSPYSDYSEEEVSEEEYPEHQRKGNPRQPSKKEKAIIRALRKL
jgi:predicted RNA-binding protein with PIN domain